jgi:general secretion pathway protein K
MKREALYRFVFAGRRADGFVLIAVLWILAALAGLVGAYVAYALTMAQSADFYLRRVSADAALSGALELAVYDLSRVEMRARPPEGVFDYRVGGATVQVRYAAETLRLDLNKASLESLIGLLGESGAGGAFAESYAQRILGWREKPVGQGAAMEDMSYRAAGVTYMPRHGPFQSVEELWDVHGLPPDVIARIAPLVTVYGGREKWRSDEQSDKKTTGAPAASGGLDSRVPQTRGAGGSENTPGGQSPNPRPEGGQEGEQTLKPTRFEIRVVDAQGRVATAEIVAIGTRDGDRPYNVLLWRTGDELAAPRDGRRR